MDQTQRIDPNRTILTGAPALNDPLKTQAMGAFDLRALGGALLGRRKRAVAES